MKVCPKCNSSFSDETLVYCLTDGTELISDKSVVDPPEAETLLKTAPVTSPNIGVTSQKEKLKKEVKPKSSNSLRYIGIAAIVAILGVGGFWIFFKSKGNTPTESYKALFAAVKSKDTEAIKKWMSKSTIGFAESVAKQQNNPVEKVFENGFTGTTFAASLPEIRDERIKDDMGAIEVWNSKVQKWEDLPFVKEEDGWKLAIGDLFAGTFQSPGPGRAAKDAEESNRMSNNIIQAPGMNANAMPKVNGKNPVPMPPAGNKPSMKQNLKPTGIANTNAPVR